MPSAGELNENAAMIVVDRATKCLSIKPMRDTADAKALAFKFLKHVLPRSGIPRVIISDRDPKFLSAFWQWLQGTKLAMYTAHHAQTDRLAERLIGTLESLYTVIVPSGPPPMQTGLP